MRTLSSYTLVVVCFLFTNALCGQSSMLASMASVDEPSIYAAPVFVPTLSTKVTPTSTEKLLFRALPTLPEGQGSIASFLRATIVYPEIAVENAIEGTIVIAVEVEANGVISDVSIVTALFGPIDQLVLASAKELPRLAPAVFNGKAVKKDLLIPIQFSLL